VEFCRSCLFITPLFEMLEHHQREKMTQRIENAVSFLQQHGRLDYSLLVLVGYSNERRRQRPSRGELHEERAGTSYDVVLRYVVIDTLTPWSARKVLEYYACRVVLGCYYGRSMKFGTLPAAGATRRQGYWPWDVVPPSHYGRRFIAMIRSILRTSVDGKVSPARPASLAAVTVYLSAASTSTAVTVATNEGQPGIADSEHY
jgi:hypothetical protein